MNFFLKFGFIKTDVWENLKKFKNNINIIKFLHNILVDDTFLLLELFELCGL
jgi:hypothetical protein